jgi:hypothetical protein
MRWRKEPKMPRRVKTLLASASFLAAFLVTLLASFLALSSFDARRVGTGVGFFA